MSAFMRWVTQTHSQRWHAAHGTVGIGHLYQGRYKSFPVQSNSYYLTLLRYVECNPPKAGLVEKAGQWPWSSLAIRTGKVDKPITLSDGQLELMLADRIVGSFWKLKRSGRMENELYVSLMDTDYSKDAITKDKPASFILSCTRPDGSRYIDTHYSISDKDGVKDMLTEPQTHEPKSPESKNSVRSLGSVALQDFRSGNILSRFRRYEGQIKRSLYKALTELQRLKWLRRQTDHEITSEEL